MNHNLDELCGNCGLTYGSHRGNAKLGDCPGHEGRMDWTNSPGTQFLPTGVLGTIEVDTPARWPDVDGEVNGG